MPVDQSSYRPWEGSLRPGRAAIFAIAGTMIHRLFRQRLVKRIAVFVPAVALLMSAIFFGFAQQAQEAMFEAQGGKRTPGILQVLLQRADVNIGQLDIMALMCRFALTTMAPMLAILMAGIVGAPLIAEDRRARALPLYFSRPITHVDYVLGKLLTVAFFLALLLVVPQIGIYLMNIGYATESGVAARDFPLLMRTLAPGLAVLTALSCMSLGISSLTEKNNNAVLLFFGVVMFSFVVSKIFAHEIFESAGWLLLWPFSAAKRIFMDLVPTPTDMTEAFLAEASVAKAWWSLVCWSALGLFLLVVRVRKVEVVS